MKTSDRQAWAVLAARAMLLVSAAMFLVAMLTSFLRAGPAEGAEAKLVPADPWEVIHVARDFGTADVGRDGMKDPQIDVTGSPGYRVVFYGCENGQGCTSVLFDARVPDVTLTEGQLDTWNRTKLFGRAWRDSQDRAVLDHVVAMSGGLPRETLTATFAAWQSALDEYKDFLGKSVP